MVTIRALTAADAPAFRLLRLDALRTAPTAFGGSYEESLALTEADFVRRIAEAAPGAIFGAADGGEMVGMAGLAVQTQVKSRHKGLLWGVYVQPSHQGTGLGRALVEAVISRARDCVLLLHASVVTENKGPRALYHRLGFRPMGIEPKALLVDGRFYDEEHLILDFTEAGA